MKRLLAIALLTASTAQAETYICELEATTGLMTINVTDPFGVVDFNKVAKQVFVIKHTEDTKLAFFKTDGKKIKECDIQLTKSANAILCHNEGESFALNKNTKKYVSTDFGIDSWDTPNDIPLPTLVGGSCDLFEE